QERPLLVPEGAGGRTAAKGERPSALTYSDARNSRCRDRMLAETAREYGNRQTKHGDGKSDNCSQSNMIPEHCARRPPECAGGVGRMLQHPIGLQCRVTREIARGEYRRNLQSDDESRSNHSRNDLSDQARAFRTDRAE